MIDIMGYVPALGVRVIERKPTSNSEKERGVLFEATQSDGKIFFKNTRDTSHIDPDKIVTSSEKVGHEVVRQEHANILRSVFYLVAEIPVFPVGDIPELRRSAQELSAEYPNFEDLHFQFELQPVDEDGAKFLVELEVQTTQESLPLLRQFLKDVNNKLEILDSGNKAHLEILIDDMDTEFFLDENSINLLDQLVEKILQSNSESLDENAVEFHEFSHSSRKFNNLREILLKIKDLPRELAQILCTLDIFDEALAMFHELRGGGSK